MTFKDIYEQIYYHLGESSTNSHFGLAFVKDMINSALGIVCNKYPYSLLLKETDISVIVTNVSAASTGTALHVDAVTGMNNKRKLIVTDKTYYEEVTIASISGLDITLDSPGLTNSYADGDYVIILDYFLPEDCGRVLSFRDMTTPQNLGFKRAQVMDREVPKIQSIGTASEVYPKGIITTKEPVSGSYTAETGTDTDTIVCSTLPAETDDYYKDWIVTNTTRGDYARVSSYTVSTKTLQLKTAIASQVSTDAFFLSPVLRAVSLYVLPDTSFTMRLKYFITPPILVNDYDVPILPEPYQLLLVYSPLVDLTLSDRNNPRAATGAQMFQQRAWDLENQLMEHEQGYYGEMESMSTADDDDEDDIL